MGEILLFPSRRPERQARAHSGSCGDPALLIFGDGGTRIDCCVMRRSAAEAILEADIADTNDVAVLIELTAGVAHYGRLESGRDGLARLAIIQTHDLDHDDTPRLLRLIWLDRVLIEGADSLGSRGYHPRPAC